MNQDQVERDRLLTEVHADVKHIVDWSKKHDLNDDARFKKITDEVDWIRRIIYGCVGVFIFVEFMVKVIK